MMCGCRFVRYLERIAALRPQLDNSELERCLWRWSLQYVDGDPANSTSSVKSRKPLAGIEISVMDDARRSLRFADVRVVPSYQFKSLGVWMAFQIDCGAADKSEP